MNVLKPDKINTIITLSNNGVSQREIFRRTAIDRKTIRKYSLQSDQIPQVDLNSNSSTLATGSEGKINQNPPPWPPAQSTKKQLDTDPESPTPATGSENEIVDYPSSLSSSQSKSKTVHNAKSACDPHREWIEKQVRLGRNGVSIYQDLVERYGFTNKYNSVKRFVRGIKKKDPKQFDRLEFPPGEEAQVDYGTGAKTLHPTGKYRKPRLFVMTLKYSRRSFRKVVWKSSQETWAKLHEEAFRYFGGCTQYVVLDNLKEGVIKPDIYEPELNPVYKAVLQHYDVLADPARVCDPDRKGTVESAIQHTQDTALKGRKFETIERQNEWLIHWEEKWAAPRIHGRAKRQVEEMFQEEKPYLKQLPLTSFRYFKQETRTVWDDGTIQVSNCYYSALPAPLHQQVIVRIFEREIEIINPRTMELYRRHNKGTRAGAVKMEEGDRIFNPSRQTNYLLSKAGKIGPVTKELCELLFKEEGRPGQRRMQGIVNLARRFEACHIEEASKKAVNAGLRSCKAVRRLVENMAKRDQAVKEENDLTQDHALIRAPEDYGAFWNQNAVSSAGDQEQSTKQVTGQQTGGQQYVMSREQLRQVWHNANWHRVIEVFGLEVDTSRRCKSDETWIKSPFTDERTASLHLSLTANTFKDFSSGKGAHVGVLNFCQELLRMQGLDMNCYEVAGWMVDNEISTTDLHPHRQCNTNNSKCSTQKPMKNEGISVDLRRWLQTDHPVLKQRAVSSATCHYLGCGFLPEKTGRTVPSPLNGRIVFQIRGIEKIGSQLKSIILTHTGRALSPEYEDLDGKYWSFPFHKSLEIFNQDRLMLDTSAHQQIKQYGLILVEGFFDVAALIGAGCLNVGALMGAQVTEPQVERIKFIDSVVKVPKIMMFLDRDAAGVSGTKKSIALLQKNGFEVEQFDWTQLFDRTDSIPVKIPINIQDAGDMSLTQLRWLRQQGII
jgi:transposase/5S rRNA maturation endonuclease (ribonuclease M5)